MGASTAMKRIFRKTANASDAAGYHYYVVENSFVARIEQNNNPPTAERLLEDGRWVVYKDVWDVCTNGRFVDSEENALAEFKAIMDMRKNNTSK
jgi:hypothetical protein